MKILGHRVGQKLEIYLNSGTLDNSHVRRLPPLLPRLARRDPALLSARRLLLCICSHLFSGHLPRARNLWWPPSAERRCPAKLLLADTRVNAARQPHWQPRRRCA